MKTVNFKEIVVKAIERKSRFVLHHTVVGTAEKVYAYADYPKLLKLANDYRFAANTGDHVHDKIYGAMFDENKRKAEEALRAGGVNAKRQQHLEDLVCLGDFEYSNGVYGVKSPHDLYLQNFKKIVLRPFQKAS